MCGPVMQAVALGVSMYSTVAGGQAAAETANFNARAAAQQRETELKLGAVEDERTRAQYRRDISQQSAQLLASGVELDSPTAVLLGQDAGRELSFASQSVRSRTVATANELSVTEQQFRNQARAATQGAGLSAAGDFFAAAPRVWPGLAGDGQTRRVLR